MRTLEWIRRHLVGLVAFLCAAFMLGVIPLLVNDAFFDINRFKVDSVLRVMPLIAAAAVFALLIEDKERAALPLRRAHAPLGAMGVFLLSCVCSAAMEGFSPAVLLGNQGRYCGLMFILMCGCAFYVIAVGRLRGSAVVVLSCVSACAVALLGVVNALGFDPLGFYERIQAGQETVFMSTIGHFDFFGTFLIMMLPLAASQYVFSQSLAARYAFLAASIVLICGAYASRTDSALIGVHLGCFALLVVSGGSLRSMARALGHWALAFALLPAVRVLLSCSRFAVSFSGPIDLLSRPELAFSFAAVMLAAAVLCRYLSGRRSAPGYGRMMKLTLMLFAAAVILLLLVIFCFTVLFPQVPLGQAQHFLRFSDRWGTYRGFVYTRALRAFEDFSLSEKLFGRGLDTARSILEPYFDDPAMLVTGVFNDTHNQFLQMLITAGLFGAGSFAALYIVLLCAFARRANGDPVLSGAFASVFAYLVVIVLNVTQPILIAAYFSIAALGVSRLLSCDERGIGEHES